MYKTEIQKHIDRQTEEYTALIIKYTKKNKFKIGNKTYGKRKIVTKDFMHLEELRAKVHTMQKADVKHEDIIHAMIDVYYYSAMYYLGMTLQEFNDTDFKQLMPILDACSYASIYPV